MTLHIYAPQPMSMQILTQLCPTCEKETEILGEHFEWYGSEYTCLECGEAWDEDGRKERPFERAWRKRRVEQARARYEAYTKAGTLKDTDVRA